MLPLRWASSVDTPSELTPPSGFMLALPTIITNYGPDARIACQAARHRAARLRFISTPAAAAHAGTGWAAAFMANLEEDRPTRQDNDQTPLWVLDCADRPGDALSAFRVGLKAVALDNISPEAARALNEIAITVQAKLYLGPIDVELPGPRLYLMSPGNIYARVDAWLERLDYG